MLGNFFNMYSYFFESAFNFNIANNAISIINHKTIYVVCGQTLILPIFSVFIAVHVQLAGLVAAILSEETVADESIVLALTSQDQLQESHTQGDSSSTESTFCTNQVFDQETEFVESHWSEVTVIFGAVSSQVT
ncbi:MAG: hypothetical protein ACOZBL_02845 [Patescibacteria group bacterium]